MVTIVNKENTNKYSVLYEDATQALIREEIKNGTNGESIRYEVDEQGNPKKDPDSGLYVAETPITTLEEYFAALPALVDLGKSNVKYDKLHSIGRRYTILPLDEDAFEINANTRDIKIPDSFKAYGVSVQGDELAEIIYFKIDRFFDAMDLDAADIYIQWENANGESGLSAPWVIDIESEPNKIIFGWALSSSITSKAGAVKFSVRFVKWNDSKTKIAYSWASLVQQIAIKTSLNFDLENLDAGDFLQELETDDTIVSRIQNTITNVTGREPADVPVFVLDLPSIADLDIDSKTGKECYTLKVQANSQDGGTVSYYWQEANSSNRLEDSDNIVIKLVFEPTTDEVPMNKTYYKADISEDGIIAYKKFDIKGLNSSLGETPASAGLFERFATCTIEAVGNYSAGAINNKLGSNRAAAESNICLIPTPTSPVIVVDIEKTGIVPEQDHGSTSLIIVAQNTETNGSKAGTLSYQWYKQIIDMDNIEDLSEAFYVDENSNPFLPIDGATRSTYTVEYDGRKEPKETEGKYLVIVTNYKNKETKEAVSSICNISFPAEAPVLSYPNTDMLGSTGVVNIMYDDPASVSQMRVEVDNEWLNKWNISDAITYQWYMSVGAQDADGTDANNKPDIAIEGATASAYMPTEIGRRYYCVVTNTKNGTSASTASHEFSVTG